MNNDSYIVDVSDKDFENTVIKKSREIPVLVDFWAAWCGPCQSLIPVLHKLAEEYQGRFLLAKVNSDEQQSLAAQYGVRSLPTVKLFVDGTVVDEFMGALPESAVREFLDRHIDQQAGGEFPEIHAALQKGDLKEAISLINKALEVSPDNTGLKIIAIRILIQQGEIETAQKLLKSLPAASQENDEVKSLAAQLFFADILMSASDPKSLLERINDNPDDLEARHQISAYMVMAHDFEAALQQLLEIMSKRREFENDAGRRGILAIFDILGNQGELVNHYRRKMAALLY